MREEVAEVRRLRAGGGLSQGRAQEARSWVHVSSVDSTPKFSPPSNFPRTCTRRCSVPLEAGSARLRGAGACVGEGVSRRHVGSVT